MVDQNTLLANSFLEKSGIMEQASVQADSKDTHRREQIFLLKSSANNGCFDPQRNWVGVWAKTLTNIVQFIYLYVHHLVLKLTFDCLL